MSPRAEYDVPALPAMPLQEARRMQAEHMHILISRFGSWLRTLLIHATPSDVGAGPGRVRTH